MDELKVLRNEIDRIDGQIVALFEERMRVVMQVGEYKHKNALPVLDSGRERQVLEAKAALVHDPALKTDVERLFETLMGISRRHQRTIVKEGAEDPDYARVLDSIRHARQPVADPRVVYQGLPGAYSEQACVNFFGPGVKSRGCEQFEDVFVALKNGEADYAVVPIENSSTGAIRQICELLTQYNGYLVGETTVEVSHCLMAPKGATLDTIREVYSHEQGLFQCDQFLSRHPDWEQIPYWDTAGSAQYVAQCGDVTKAAICSRRAAELYGLTILAERVNHNKSNTTRFVVVSPAMELRPGRDKISTIITLPNESGALHEILTIFAVQGLNVVKLESRPIPGHNWEYLFFLEFLGSLDGAEMDGVFHELAQSSRSFRVLGNFKSNLEGDGA